MFPIKRLQNPKMFTGHDTYTSLEVTFLDRCISYTLFQTEFEQTRLNAISRCQRLKLLSSPQWKQFKTDTEELQQEIQQTQTKIQNSDQQQEIQVNIHMTHLILRSRYGTPN